MTLFNFQDNINVFLAACENNFGLKKTQLFDPSDLEDLTQRAIADEYVCIVDLYSCRSMKYLCASFSPQLGFKTATPPPHTHTDKMSPKQKHLC